MKKRLFISIVVFTTLMGCSGSNNEYVKVGDTVPDFTVQMFDGDKININELRGKVVLLNFWATWCPPCRQELARVQEDIIDRFEGHDFLFLPISREDSYDDITKFRESTGYQFPMGTDTERAIFSKFADEYIPRNYLIDRDGKIILTEIGYEEEIFSNLIKEIEKALSK